MHMRDCFRAPEKPFTAGLRDWLGIPEPIMACSGTAAFVVALRTLARRNPGRSRVVVPAYTCPLVPLAVRLAGLRAVACDTLPGGFGIDPGALGRCCDETALAVVPAHLGGRASDISAVSAVAHDYGAVVIEDAAQALGASFGGRSVGLSGDIGFFSLAVGKGLTTYEGGVLFSRDPDLHAELQGTASRVLRPGLLWNARRVLELLGYAVAYNPALLPLAYGRPLRRGLDRGDEIAAVGDAFTLDGIPLHRMDPLRLRVAANALERLPAFLEAGRDRAVRRAGLDYWHLVDVRVYDDLGDFYAKNNVAQQRLFSTKAPRSYCDVSYDDGCYLFFGRETKGLPEPFLEAHYDDCVRIPIREEARSLNLSNSVAIGVFEALRQLNFPHLRDYGKMKV